MEVDDTPLAIYPDGVGGAARGKEEGPAQLSNFSLKSPQHMFLLRACLNSPGRRISSERSNAPSPLSLPSLSSPRFRPGIRDPYPGRGRKRDQTFIPSPPAPPLPPPPPPPSFCTSSYPLLSSAFDFFFERLSLYPPKVRILTNIERQLLPSPWQWERRSL